MLDDPEIWTTEDGREISVKELTDLHLLNCISFLKEKFYNRVLMPKSKILQQVQGKTEEVVMDNVIENLRKFSKIESRWPIYSSLVREARLRGLQIPEPW
jgi:hypothetical protein